ncbi:phage major capsid protein [Lacticaseibacillus paracasei]|uniref:phage major capsid protein n=1 Tax=Lacticaseibacillus paracasei TaxID=1597 RepID=UPI001378251C|nr:phage major capsid protein [Lacticaseibacillus paracasei]MCZ2766174.1 phage major capsid protein [Lacticaseibacillus paracasei]MCZ2769115.1 phage major capsid protein [Lacticaseibacillus paracasei]MCZ2774624.1 phage major capsid protein [Lacticaseibacillus paracasei]MCZ2777581.1 phage major capsid protein [Lacticaseibacillus paracasei]MCZ2783645.1 phage major capsid protein [Lacticaseibacillus paracasei]
MENEDIRTFNVQIRAETAIDSQSSNNQVESNQNMAISGIATVFNQPSIKGNFTEYIDQNALNGVDLSNVLLLYSHDFSNILARADAGTLQTSIQPDGLHLNAQLPDTQLGKDTYTNILNGNIKGMSFGFNIAPDGDSWSVNSQGKTIHTIHKIGQVFELSLTPIPAYTETSVQVQRDLAQFLSSKKEVVKMAEKPEEKPEEKEEQSVDDQKRSIEQLQSQLADLQAKINTKVVIDKPEEEKRDATPDVASDETTAQPTSGDLVSMITTLQAAIQSLSQQLADQQAPSQMDDDVPDDDSNVVLDEKKPKQETAEIEKRDGNPDEVTAEQDVKQENKRDGEKQMAKNLTADKVEDEEVRDFKEFLKTGEIKRDSAGFDSAAGEAVLPSQVLDIMSQPKDPAQLGGYVTKVQVSAPTGKIPVLSKASAQLVSAAELADNPKLANASLTQVNYDVQTLRGSLPISLEMTQDYPNITSLLTQYINDIKDQTEQHKIGAVLQTATTVAAKSIDDIKDAFNVGLSNYSDRMFVASESFFAAIDKQKDAEGRYLLQDSITSPSGKQLFGAPLVVVADDVLGKSGDAKAFIGSVKNFVVETVKGNINLSWQRNENFEQVLLAALRADFKAADTAAGKFITYTAPVTPTVPTATSGK